MAHFENTAGFAALLDEKDELRSFREEFYHPVMHGKEVVYLAGNSLGLQPRVTQDYILTELEDWATFGVEGHLHARNPWWTYQDFLTNQIATLLGALPSEVVAMNSLTVNLHLLLVSFYRPDKKRFKIICEYDTFPSDLYALQSQIAFHGFNVDEALIFLKPRPGEYCLNQEDVIKAIEDAGESLACIMMGAVNYYTGQKFDLKAITEAGHKIGATVGFNLAHAAGNVELRLHDWNVDFACFCSYKYLNSGPGSTSGIFIHERHGKNDKLPRFAGWWGNDPDSRFSIPRTFIPAEGARGWQLSNAPVFAMAPFKASLDIFEDAGFDNCLAKSKMLTGFMVFLLEDMISRFVKSGREQPLIIITPADETQRGCQLSLIVKENAKDVFNKLIAHGVIVDWREPNVIRAAPVPLYNSFTDVFNFVQMLESFLS